MSIQPPPGSVLKTAERWEATLHSQRLSVDRIILLSFV